MVVFRGTNYEGPLSSQAQSVNREGDALFVPIVSSSGNLLEKNSSSSDNIDETRAPVVPNRTESMTAEEAEFNSLLDGLGPRFEEWWGTGILPVDADLLPQKVPGYKTPFRLLPTGMRPRLTNAEMTDLRKLAKSLPCHFALGNFHHLKFLRLMPLVVYSCYSVLCFREKQKSSRFGSCNNQALGKEFSCENCRETWNSKY